MKENKIKLPQVPERRQAYRPQDTLSLAQPEAGKVDPPKWSDNDSLTKHLESNFEHRYRKPTKDWKSENNFDPYKGNLNSR